MTVSRPFQSSSRLGLRLIAYVILGPDSEARVILQHAADAMKKGYSRLLINEWVLSDTNSSLLAAMMDINMMCLFAGTERTRSQWDALLGSAGLKIVKLWGPGQETESLIEAVLE